MLSAASLLNDIASEMIFPLLPGFLLVVLHGNKFALGIIEGLTKVFYPEASNTVIFIIMVVVLLIRPAGLFGKER